MIAFYYGLTGFACAIYYRRELFTQREDVPADRRRRRCSAALMLLGDLRQVVHRPRPSPENSESGDSWFGLGPPLVIGLGFLLLGVVLMLFWRIARTRDFFRRRPEVADPKLLDRSVASDAGPIVVGYDGTDGARAALHEARADRAAAAAPTSWSRSATRPRRLGGEVGDLATSLHERGEQITAEAVRVLADAGVTATSEVVPGRIAEELSSLADTVDAQMLVVGSYGQRTLTSLLLGSTPNKLLHLSHRPVLVVRG